MNTDRAKIAWRYMTLLKASQEKDSTTRHLSGTEFQILAYVGWRQGKAYIHEILEHPMFKYNSLSTIKRAVMVLKQEGLIESSQIMDGDSRIMCLTIKEKV